MKIVIIDPAKHRIEATVFNKIANYSPLKCEYHVPQFSDSYLEIDHSEVAGMIFLGSDFDVRDQPPWQNALTQYILRCKENNIPTLGICYGHQLIAHVFDCELGYYTKDQKKFKGSRKIKLYSNNIWKEKEFEMQYSHRQVVSSLSSKMEILGTSLNHQFEALKHIHSDIYTFQGHPEQSLSNEPYNSNKNNYWVIKRFIDYVCNTEQYNHL